MKQIAAVLQLESDRGKIQKLMIILGKVKKKSSMATKFGANENKTKLISLQCSEKFTF